MSRAKRLTKSDRKAIKSARRQNRQLETVETRKQMHAVRKATR